MKRSLASVLESVSDIMFPDNNGNVAITVSSRDASGDTPLHKLLWKNDTEGAIILIEAEADINAIGEMGETPLHIAISQNNETMVKHLLRAGANLDIRSHFGNTARELLEKKS
tara:strand:- start:2984 stop:3322 length:339 start_codon:yes stop_codon:yes gene_type:complete